MRSRSFGSVLILAAFGAGVLCAARASADMFHLAQDGLCNHSDKEYTFVMIIDDGVSVKVSNRKGFHNDHGGTLAVGECATATFEITNNVGCEEGTVTFQVGTGRGCTVNLTPDSATCGDGRGITYTCDGGLRFTHGDEHFQIEIKN
jgi:hypothetical protein